MIHIPAWRVDADSTRLVSMALIGYGALIVFTVSSHLFSYFIARRKVRFITLISFISIMLNVLFDGCCWNL